MKVKVIDISPSKTAEKSQFDPNQEIETYDVVMLIDEKVHQFKLAVDVDKIGARQISIVKTDIEFDEIFKFDLKLHRDICKLVSKVYNQQPYHLPVELGELQTPSVELVKIVT